MKKITDIVWELAEPAVQEQGCRIWDVEYVREAGQWYLRLYLDKDGGVDILDCEAISRTVSDLPKEALDYVRYLEAAVGCRIKYVSVGADRDAYIKMF